MRSFWLAICIVCTGSVNAFQAIDTSVYFPAVVQGHHGVQTSACAGVPNPQLKEVNNPKINGTGGNKLAFCSITTNQNNIKNCDDGQGGYKVCAITEKDIGGLSLSGNNAFPSNGAQNDVNCQNNGSATLDQAAYRNVNSSGCQLTMTSKTRYQITSLTMNNGGTLTLGPGDHFFETLSLDNTTVKLQSPDQALTRIFVKNIPNLKNTLLINKDGKQNLIWVSYNNFSISDNAKFVGYLYAGGTVTLGNHATLTGRITASVLEVNDSVINKGDAVVPLPSPDCNDIFTDPPSEGASMAPPPGVLVPPLADLSCSSHKDVTTCSGHSSNRFAPGDHDFNNGSIGNDAELVATGATARLYFNNLDLNNARLNLTNPPENLFIYVKGDLSIAGQNEINAIVYVAGDVKMSGNATIDGALAAGGSIDINGNGEVDFSQDAVNKIDLGGTTCGGGTGGTNVDHFELDHSGQALTCNPEPITIRACANAACSSLVTTPVSLTLSPVAGWVGGNQVNLTAGNIVKQLSHTTAGALTLGVSSSTPAASSTTLCRAGSGALSSAACILDFADSGFVFDVLDTLANKPQSVQLKAVKRDDASQQCVPVFANVSKAVSFWSDYVSPTANNFGRKVTVNGSAVATSQGAATTSNLSFDDKGETTLTVNYPDAGQMQLNARHDGSGDTAGLVMTGADQFISRPVGLCIVPDEGSCMEADASCPVFRKTGETFPLSITGRAWQADDDGDYCSGNLATPNFALANIALATQLVAPIPGVNAAVGTPNYNHTNEAGSNNLNNVNQSVNEVGVFRMVATPPTNGYFGYTIPPASSVPVGRFVPWDFNLVSPEITPACNSFTYMSQPFASGFVITARNSNGGTTQNYAGAFAKGIASMVAANALDGVDRSARITLSPSLEWVDGVASVNQQLFKQVNTSFDRGSAPEAPLPLLDVGILVDDNDGGQTVLAGANMNPEVAGECQGAGCNAVRLGTQELRYGRLLASTEQGIASEPLALALQMQYYQGGDWRLNEADLCTQLSLANGGITFTDSSQHYDAASGELSLGGSTGIRVGLGSTAPGGVDAQADEGEIRFHFGAPDMAVKIPYRVELDKQPSQPLWLADPSNPNSLIGEAIFGSTRGNDRIIYRREVMP